MTYITGSKDLLTFFISNQTTTKVLSYQPKMVLKTINCPVYDFFIIK